MDKLTHTFLSSAIVISCFSLGHAQGTSVVIPTPRIVPQVVVTQPQQSGVAVAHGTGKEMGFQFVGTEPAVSTRIVKGQPYFLEASVDTEQNLADGNRIVHHQIVHVYRDSEGRTRREETLAAIGPWAASGTPPTIVTIQDPVSGVTYSLDPQNKIATKLPTGSGKILTAHAIHSEGDGIAASASPDEDKSSMTIAAFGAGANDGGGVVVQNEIATPMERSDENSESLGKESIAGISAEGVRVTTTIPAEAVGNERPIEITRERWFSPELQIVLRSKQTDPRFGVTTYEVTKLDRENPPHSLFEVPRDYRITKAPQPPSPPAPPK